MEELKEQIREFIKDKYGLDAEVEWMKVPAEVEGDYATNAAMRIAKQVGKKPREIAEEIVRGVGGGDFGAGGDGLKLEVAGAGFINVSVMAKKLWEKLGEEWSQEYGKNKSGEGKVAIVEFPSINMAKPYSVGHLRPGTQGWATKKLLEANGWKVITDNHLGDAGTPFGIWAVGFIDSGKKLEEITVYDLGEIYIDMKARLKKEEAEGGRELAERVQEWLLKLEAKDSEAVALSEGFGKISLDHMHEVMERMGLETDYELGESFYVEQGKELVARYLEEGTFVKNPDGSVICPLDGFEVPMLVLKSNGAALYATTDLGCMVYRAEKWQPDKVVYCAGAEQKFYFEQLFAMGKKLGLKQENVHLWFGTIDQVGEDGKREKMSSRKGVVLLEDMLNDAERRVRGNFGGIGDGGSGRDGETGGDGARGEGMLSNEDIKKIAVGAIKFSDFVADRKTGILYDPEKIFALTGCSGPFCQYAVVRMRRILEKFDGGSFDVSDSEYDFEAEKEVILKLLAFPEVVKEAGERLEAHRVAGYAFELAQEMNRYYERTPVGTAEEGVRGARLAVIAKAEKVLSGALELLGIEVPSKM